MIYRGIRGVIIEVNNIDLLEYTGEYFGEISANSRVVLAKSFRKSCIFFGVGSIILLIVLQVRLMFFRWKKWMIS